jgi:hypothetical protein
MSLFVAVMRLRVDQRWKRAGDNAVLYTGLNNQNNNPTTQFQNQSHSRMQPCEFGDSNQVLGSALETLLHKKAKQKLLIEPQLSNGFLGTCEVSETIGKVFLFRVECETNPYTCKLSTHTCIHLY